MKSVSPGGYITITETDGARRTYEARAQSDGSLEHLKAREDAARSLRSEYEQNRALAALARTGSSSTRKTTAAVFQALGSGR